MKFIYVILSSEINAYQKQINTYRNKVHHREDLFFIQTNSLNDPSTVQQVWLTNLLTVNLLKKNKIKRKFTFFSNYQIYFIS